jgi:hypothetical protein
VAVGDLSGDWRPDIVTGPANNATHNVKAFNGLNYTVLADFKPYSPAFNSSVRVGVGDVEGTGMNSMVTVPGPSGGAHVRAFVPTAFPTVVTELCSFFAYPEPNYLGLYVGAPDAAPPVTWVDFVTPGTTGDLTFDNPSVFAGGWRFFPDAASLATNNTSRNVVRVRATVQGTGPGVTVYFRSFDVDDPSTDVTIDPNLSSGGDNRGRLNASANYPAVAGSPGAITSAAGQLRRLGGAWAGDGQIVSAITSTTGAEVELATTFAPGDNYRVLASTDLNALLNYPIPPTVVPTTGDPPNFRGKATPQLSVWRHLHVERDRMDDDEILGDWFQLDVTAEADAGGGQWTLTVQKVPGVGPADGDQDALIKPEELEGGILRNLTTGVNYPIVSNTNWSPTLPFSVTVSAAAAPGLAGARVNVYEDDFHIPAGQPANSLPVRRVNPESDAVFNAMYQFMGENASRTTNRFADAYIQPTYGAVGQFNNVIPAVKHVKDSLLQDPDVKLGGMPPGDSQRGSRAFETDLFWIVYVTSANEYTKLRDFDADLFQPTNPTAADEAYVIDGTVFPSAKGVTEAHNQTSFVFIEASFDHWNSHRNFPTTPLPGETEIKGTFAATELEQYGRTTIHEVGHQLDIADTPSEHRTENNDIMNAGTHLVPLEPGPTASRGFYFHPSDIVKLRGRLKSPGAGL